MIIETIKLNDEKHYQKMLIKSNLLDKDIETNEITLGSFKRHLYKIIDFETNIDGSIIDDKGNLKDIKVNTTISMDSDGIKDNYYGIFLFTETHVNIGNRDETKIFKLRDIYRIEEIFIISYGNSQSQVLTISAKDLTFQIRTKCLLKCREIIELEILLKPCEFFMENLNSKNK